MSEGDTQTWEEFKGWLRGFLHGKNELDAEDIESIVDEVNRVDPAKCRPGAGGGYFAPGFTPRPMPWPPFTPGTYPNTGTPPPVIPTTTCGNGQQVEIWEAAKPVDGEIVSVTVDVPRLQALRTRQRITHLLTQ